MLRSSHLITAADAKRDTTYAFPEKGTRGTLTVVFMQSPEKNFVHT